MAWQRTAFRGVGRLISLNHQVERGSAMARSLTALGIELVDPSSGLFACRECGWTFMVNNPGWGKRRPRGWWHCQQGCNLPDE